METKDIQKTINRVVGTEGTLRIPSWWMHKILSDLVKYCEKNEGASVNIKEYVESQLNLVGKTIEDLDTRLENIESHELFEILSELPSEPKDNTIYLIPSQNGEDNNVLTEWVHINGTWEQFGEFKANVNLSEYAKKEALDELSKEIALRNVGAEDTDESVDEPDLPTPSASNEWKRVFDGRMGVGVRDIDLTTFADGTPLKAKEMIIQILMDKSAARNSQGYIQVQSTTNKNMVYYGAIHFEAVHSNDVTLMSQCKMVASPYTYMVAEIIDKMPLAVAQGAEAWGRAGHNNAAQIYEDFVFLRLGPSNPTTEAAPYLKIYAR